MPTNARPAPPKWLLDLAIKDDTHEEDAIDFLDDNGIPYASHNRSFLITLAYQHGWRPRP